MQNKSSMGISTANINDKDDKNLRSTSKQPDDRTYSEFFSIFSTRFCNIWPTDNVQLQQRINKKHCYKICERYSVLWYQ